jgi:lambda repressor-like predicted transcriptional regulator
VAAIKNRGYTLEKLATDHGYSPASINVALLKPWPAVEKIVAETIGVAAHVIWPPRYDRFGVPIKRGRTKESSGSIHGTVGETAEAKSKPGRQVA